MSSTDSSLQIKEFKLEMGGYRLQAKSLRLPGNSDQKNPTLVFLHDSLGCIQLWRDFPEKLALATQYNAFLYDRQGYGQSEPFGIEQRKTTYLEEEARILAEVLQKADIEQAILFGHSDGGSIALVAAAEYPELIKGIITEGAHVFVEGITLTGIREAVEAYKNTSLPQKLAKYHGDKTEAVFRAWTDTWLSPDFRNWNIENYLQKIKCPALIIQGKKDEYGSEAQVESIVQHSGGKAEKWMIPGIGHSPHKEAPKDVLRRSADFIRHSIL
jgi:pimeloyl-ACP methyl ester carboxylesterase